MVNVTSQPVFDFTANSSCIGDNCTTTDVENVSLDADYAMRFVYCAVGSVGMIGNAVVVGVILGAVHMRRVTTNVLIANQSAIDFLASFFIILCTLIRDVKKVKGLIAKEIFCRMWSDNFPIWGLFVSSTYNLVCITTERYFGIVYPMSHSRTCSKGKARFALGFAWIIGLAYNMAYMVPSSPYKDGACTSYSQWPSLAVQRVVGLLTIALQFFIPILIIAFAYIRIVFVLHKVVGPKNGSNKSENPQDVKREKRMKRARMNVVKTLVMVAMSFILCWSPNQIIYTMYNCGIEIDFNGTFYHFTVIAVFLNCCINPFIYSFQFDQFKNELFKRCRKAPDRSDMSVRSHSIINGNDACQRNGGPSVQVRELNGDNNVPQTGDNGEFDNICYDED